MTDHVRDSPSSTLASPTAFTYPHASAPDIIRSHQKDVYFQAQLSTHLTSVLRSLRGARFTHTYATDLRALADVLYLSLTTLLGNRTLGEEYCDIVQLSSSTSNASATLPETWRRALYIFSSVLIPYGLQKVLPSFRRKLRAKLEISLRRRNKPHNGNKEGGQAKSKSQTQAGSAWTTKFQKYVLANLDTLTSPSPVYALSLSAFYFTGAYYHLSKRLLNLRYIFTRRLEPHETRSGYEILGVLLMLQLSVQSYLHITDTLSSSSSSSSSSSNTSPSATIGEEQHEEEEEEIVSLDHGAYATNTALLPPLPNVNPASTTDPETARHRIEKLTNTHYADPSSHSKTTTSDPAAQNTTAKSIDLEDKSALGWIEGSQQRKCTLCLEAMKDPAVTTCGHVFCWGCICDWLGEKAECPLCRQGVLVQKVLVLR